jgi:predicted Zn-dependent peptidase
MMQPVPGHAADELLNELEAVFRRLATTEVDGPDLTRAKSKARAGIMERLETNEGLASILPRYVVDFNDWKRLETAVDLLNRVSLTDLQRVASRYFTAANRTMAVSGLPMVAAAAAGSGAAK